MSYTLALLQQKIKINNRKLRKLLFQQSKGKRIKDLRIANAAENETEIQQITQYIE